MSKIERKIIPPPTIDTRSIGLTNFHRSNALPFNNLFPLSTVRKSFELKNKIQLKVENIFIKLFQTESYSFVVTTILIILTNNVYF